MADISTTSRGDKRQPKTRKRSTKIDMTAMVDVAFLLLTFFVLTATISDIGVKEMIKPPKNVPVKPLVQDRILTVVLEEDQVLYYVGITDPEIRETDFSASGIRKAMQTFMTSRPDVPFCSEVNNEGLSEGKCWDPIILIKAKPTSRYRNLVDILDEVSLLDLKYALGEFTEADSSLIEDAMQKQETQALAESGIL